MSEQEINFFEIEKKWQERWYKAKINEADPIKNKKKIFITIPYPYMNGHLHIGFAFTSSRGEFYGRYKRMQGFNVLFPMAWHWTGEPIAGTAKRIAKGDEKLINLLKRIDKISDDDIKNFVDPIYIAKYYTERAKPAIMRLGYLVDWRREFYTTSLNKEYSAFVGWQYKVLRDKGYVTKGTHPVIWCPNDKSPTGDHDRLEGEGVSPDIFYLIKFKFEDGFLVAATLRPETIFGVTNIWIKPDEEYSKVKVKGEIWFVSKPTITKLKEQDFEPEIIEIKSAEYFIGKKAYEPVFNKEIPILPATFIDPQLGTGIVYSVPAHAPYDYVGLIDLLNNEEILRRFNLNKEDIIKIKPISIIHTDEFGDYSAIEVVKKMKIKNQNDPKLEEATKLVYSEEFKKGKLKENCLNYSGMNVSEARKKIIEELASKSILDKLYDTPSPVICRCGTRCIVAIFKDQWFLKYSDENWKSLVRKAIDRMKFYPNEARKMFIDTVEWLEDKACTRKSGLGTNLPWDKSWIIEPLSDSTIYMAYYIIAKYINQGLITEKNMLHEFFDYIFLGKGDPAQVSQRCGIDERLLNEIKEEFEYWYPVDLRNSAKELIYNHLTFFIYHHVAIFPEDKWPVAIGINGLMNLEGEKLSKSKGNIISIQEAVDTYGADTIRLFLALAAEGLDDVEWTSKGLNQTKNTLNSLFNFISKLITIEGTNENTSLDKWILSVLQKRIKQVTEFFEELKIRSATNIALYEIWSDVKWYLKRVEKPNISVIRMVLETWIKLLTPIIPHTCEELWERLGKTGFVSLANWPSANENLINEKEEARELLFVKILSDIQNIMAKKEQIKSIIIYEPSEVKYEILKEINFLAKKGKGQKEVLGIINSKFKIENQKQIISTLAEYYYTLDQLLRKTIDHAEEIDKAVIEELERYYSKEGIKVKVYKEDEKVIYDPLNKAKRSLPFKIGLYIE